MIFCKNLQKLMQRSKSLFQRFRQDSYFLASFKGIILVFRFFRKSSHALHYRLCNVCHVNKIKAQDRLGAVIELFLAWNNIWLGDKYLSSILKVWHKVKLIEHLCKVIFFIKKIFVHKSSLLCTRDDCKRPVFDQLNAHILERQQNSWRLKMCVFSWSKHGHL